MKNGCGLWHNCFTCPYPDCIIGNRGLEARLARKEEIIRLVLEGYSHRRVAEMSEVHVRTVRRYMSSYFEKEAKREVSKVS